MDREEAFIRAAKVLFYGSLDEAFSLKKAILVAREKSDFEQLRLIHNLLEKKQNNQFNFHTKNLEEGQIQIAKGIRLEYWREFKFNSVAEVFYPILYKWIGDFKDHDIKNLLNLSGGAILMRYNTGVIRLGSFIVREVSGE